MRNLSFLAWASSDCGITVSGVIFLTRVTNWVGRDMHDLSLILHTESIVETTILLCVQ